MIRHLLVERAKEAFQRGAQAGKWASEFDLSSLEVKRCPDLTLGDFSLNLAFLIASKVGETPAQVAADLASFFTMDEATTQVIATPEGFLNIHFSSTWLFSFLERLEKEGTEYGKWSIGKGKSLFIQAGVLAAAKEVSPNQARILIFGSAIARLLKAIGYHVHLEARVLDHAGVSIDPDLSGLRVELDRLYTTSSLHTQSRVPDMTERLKESGGELFLDGENLTLQLVEEIAYQKQQKERNYNHYIYLAPQNQLKEAFWRPLSESFGFQPQELEFIGFAPLNLSSELSNWTPSLLSHAILRSDPAQPLSLDLSSCLLEDDSNPLFSVAYAHARLCSWLRTAQSAARMFASADLIADLKLLDLPLERELLLAIASYPDHLLKAAVDFAPQHLLTFAETLANNLRQYVTQHRIIDPQNVLLSMARLRLIDMQRQLLSNILFHLMNIDAPERFPTA